MRVSPSLGRMAAALSLVLLPFGVSGEGVLAQAGGAETIGTIENTAEASYTFAGRPVETQSNTVTFDVTSPPPTIQTFRPTTSGGVSFDFRAPVCSATGQGGQAGSGSGSTDIELTPMLGSFEQSGTTFPMTNEQHLGRGNPRVS